MINLEESNNIETFGLAALDEDGNVRFYLSHGTGSPVGQQAPVPTIYIDEINSNIWRKTGAGVNDWSVVSSVTSADFLSGVDIVGLLDTLTVPDGKQTINFTQLTIDGCLDLDGDLWLA